MLNIKRATKSLKETFCRFPVTVIAIIIIVILLFIELHYSRNFSESTNQLLIKAIFSFITASILSIGVYITSENNKLSNLSKNLYQLIPIIFGILFFIVFSEGLDNLESLVFFFLSLFGIVSYLFFAPYLNNLFRGGIKQPVFYSYFYNISVLFFISFILAGILFSLGAIGIATVESLFDLYFRDKNSYGNWAIISLALITPLYALSQMPNKDTFNEDTFKESKFFSFLIKYILTPSITIYFLILYAYTLKVLLNFGEWPKGEVSWMVIGFSIFGYITYIFSYAFNEKSKFLKLFRAVFPYIVIPQVFMLFYAIYLRINQYDITINRYFVVAFGIWLLIISLYYIFSKKKSLIIMPVFLTLFTIILSVGPWSVYSLPETRQLDRLKTNLLEANILKNNQITPLLKEIDINQDLSKNIYSGINYLCNFNNCKSIKELFPIIYKEIFDESKIEWEKQKKEDLMRYEKNKSHSNQNYNESYKKEIENRTYEGPNQWTIGTEITKRIKVSSYFYGRENNEKYLKFYKEYSKSFFPIDISGYSKIYKIIGVNNSGISDYEYAEYDPDIETIKIIYNGGNTETISTKQLTEKLLKKENTELRIEELDIQSLSFEIEENNKKYRLFFEKIKIKNPKYINRDGENYRPYSYIEGFILVE